MNPSTSALRTDQVSRLLDTREDIPDLPDDGISPLMPFPTSYELTRDREEELVDHAMQRLQELEGEMGRDIAGGGNWWSGDAVAMPDAEGTRAPQKTWMGKRILFDKTFKNEMDWRPGMLGGIFADSNLVIPAARRICRQMIARAVNYFFGTSPWFAIYPVGTNDKQRADQADRYTRWKLDKAKFQRAEEQAVERAFILGEAVVKTTWRRKEQLYRTRTSVLVDAEGKDILGADGDYITESDLWVQEQRIDPVTREVVTSNLMVLKRDGRTPKPEVMTFVEKSITRRMVHYKGPKADVVNFLDFLCPLDAENVQDADCVVHLYDKPLMELADEWMKALPDNASAAERKAALVRAIAMLRRINTGDGETSSAQNSDAVDSTTKAGKTSTRRQPIVKIAEFHLRYDADGDGILEDVFLIVDRDSRTPIFYEYVANVSHDGMRPYSVVRVNEIPGRWYGMGAMEMMNPSQEIVDLWMNRKNKAVGGSGRVTFWDPSSTLEGRSRKNLELNDGGTYTLVPGKKAEDALQRVYLEDPIGDELTAMMEFVMQVMLNESGVANANDGNAVGMDSTELATGIRNIEKSGQELFSLFLGHLEPGLSEALQKMVGLLFANLDELETYRYFEEGEMGGEDATEMKSIDPNDISNMEVDTNILMTRHRGEQILESYSRGWEIVQKFYSLPFEVQVNVAEMAIDMLKAMQVPNAKDRIIPTQVLQPAPGGTPDAIGMRQAGSNPPRRSQDNL